MITITQTDTKASCIPYFPAVLMFLVTYTLDKIISIRIRYSVPIGINSLIPIGINSLIKKKIGKLERLLEHNNNNHANDVFLIKTRRISADRKLYKNNRVEYPSMAKTPLRIGRFVL